MRTMCSREIFTKKCRQQQIFDSDLKGAWHYNHVTFTPIAKNFMLYCRLIYMLSILCVRLTIKVKVGIPESFKVGWYLPKKTGSSHLKGVSSTSCFANVLIANIVSHFAMVLDRWPNLFCLIKGLKNDIYTCVSDFPMSWLKKTRYSTAQK